MKSDNIMIVDGVVVEIENERNLLEVISKAGSAEKQHRQQTQISCK